MTKTNQILDAIRQSKGNENLLNGSDFDKEEKLEWSYRFRRHKSYDDEDELELLSGYSPTIGIGHLLVALGRVAKNTYPINSRLTQYGKLECSDGLEWKEVADVHPTTPLQIQLEENEELRDTLFDLLVKE